MFSNQESVLRYTRVSTTDHYKKINKQLSVYMIGANTVRTQFRHEPITLVLVTIENLSNLYPWCDICLTF